MKNKCLAAYTEPNSYPAFINISYDENEDVVVIVRDRGNDKDGASKNISSITIPHVDFFKLLTELFDKHALHLLENNRNNK
jgi:hypothetical protein